MTWGRAIRSARERAGIGLRACARRARMSATALSHGEAGHTPAPPRGTRARLYEAIGLSPAEAVEMEGLAARERCAACDALLGRRHARREARP